MFSTCLFVCPSSPFVCYRTCERDISKVDERMVHGMRACRGRRSKFKVTGGLVCRSSRGVVLNPVGSSRFPVSLLYCRSNCCAVVH